MAKNNFKVGRDHQGRTCIYVGIVDRDQLVVGYIPMPEGEGFHLEITTEESWVARYKVMPKYPIEKACQLFLNYCTVLGATDEVLDALATIITVTKEDREMATSKFSNPPPTNVKKKRAPKKATAKTEPKKAPAKKAPAKKRVSKAKVEEYKSAAAMFQGLIMEGKLSDDDIFATVQEQFGLDDKKRSYVGWYRNKLKKDGQNPPEAK